MSGFERKKLPNGEENPKYIDLCDEDQTIAGQKFTCLSFISCLLYTSDAADE